MTKKFLSALIAFLMVFGCAVSENAIVSENFDGFSVSAEEETEATYTLDEETGILTIHGDGYYTPSFYGNEKIKKVIIEEGVEEIGIMAFGDCVSLKEIKLPESLIYICQAAFWGCTGLTSVTIPKNVSYLGGDGFAFAACTNLGEINVEEGNETFFSVDGVLFGDVVTHIFDENSNESLVLKTLFFYPEGKMDESYTVPDGIENIGYFEMTNEYVHLKSITIPESVQYIWKVGYLGYEEEEKIEGFTIYGYTGSAAEEYAKENGFEFISLGEAEKNYDNYAEFSIEQKTITLDEANNEVTVSLNLDNNTIINFAAFQFSYDEDLTLVKFEEGQGVEALINNAMVVTTKNEEKGMFSLASTPDESKLPYGSSGEIVKLTFKINNPEKDREYKISVENTEPIQYLTENFKSVVLTPSFTDGYIKIADESEEQEVKGDINGDGETTAEDALNILQMIVFSDKEFTAGQKKLADVDGDGEITAYDALVVLRIVVGLEK